MRTRVIRTGVRFILPYRRQILYASLALVFTAVVTLSLGQGIRLLIDEGFATQSTRNLSSSIQFFLALVVAMAVGTFTRYYWVSWIGERVVTDIRRQVFSHLIFLHPGFFEDNRSLEIQSRLTADTTLLQSVIGSSVSIALRNLLMLIGGVIWLFLTNAKLTAIVILSVPLVVAPILFFGRKVRKLSRDNQDRIADVGSYVGEILGQIKTVQAYNHQDLDIERFNSVAEDAFTVAVRRVKQRAWLITLVIVLVLGAIAAMLWVGGNDVISGEISGGELAAFLFYSIVVGSAVGSISEVISELQRAAGALERITELLATQSEIFSPEELATPTASPHTNGTHPHIIELNQIRFHYPSRPDKWAIDDLNLTINTGETLALVGPSGAGKSTLFDLLLRFYDVQSGSIRLNGEAIRNLDLKQLRGQFALVSQQPALFFGTIEDNIRYGCPDASDEQIREAAIAAHADEFIRVLPEGYKTRLGDAGIGLSGGQKQRLAIARAILLNSPILLLDEATSALDAESEYLVQSALEKLMQNKTTLVIAHRLATVKTADRIAVMNNGKIEAIGQHDYLVNSNPLYRRLASLQFETEQSTQSSPIESLTDNAK